MEPPEAKIGTKRDTLTIKSITPFEDSPCMCVVFEEINEYFYIRKDCPEIQDWKVGDTICYTFWKLRGEND